MKHAIPYICLILILITLTTKATDFTTGTLVLRSQGFHADRQKMVGLVDHIDLFGNEAWNGVFDIGVGYMQSFRPANLANAFFGSDVNCCDHQIKVQGSMVSNRDPNAWLADYLYLPCTFNGAFSISPRISNIVIDLDLCLGLDEWLPGFYCRIYGPITWTKWQPNFCETTVTSTSFLSTSSCPVGYFTPSGQETFLQSIGSYFRGDAPTSPDGIVFDGLQKAKIDCRCKDTAVGFADLRFMLGYNLLQDEDYHLGFNVQAAAPTGTMRDGTMFMQPVIGNGGHWELGGGLTAHTVLWRSEDEEKHVGLYLDGSITHLFSALENRTYDVDDNPNSRYMLIMRFDTPAEFQGNLTVSNIPNTSMPELNDGEVSTPRAQFVNEYSPLANLSTVYVTVDIPFQADVAIMLNFSTHGFSWDVGYDFWGRACENKANPTIPDACQEITIVNSVEANIWAFKGDAQMFGYDVAHDSEPVQLSASENSATIHSGTNAVLEAEGFPDATSTNLGVDSALYAYGNTSDTSITPGNFRLINSPDGMNDEESHIQSSSSPIFINGCNLAYTQQETMGLSHKFFTNFRFSWEGKRSSTFIGFGGSAEFGRGSSCTSCTSSISNTCSANGAVCTTVNNCNCVQCAITQWSAWIKGGISFY